MTSGRPASSADSTTDATLSAEDLRRAAPFVRRNAIRAGDVMLSRGRKSHSALIAATTGGLYSHAAIWVPVRSESPDILYLVESDSVGVGPTYPHMMTIEHAETIESVYGLPGSPSAALVLRHPGMAAIEIPTILDALEALRDAEFGKAYSRLARLPFAARDLDPIVQRAASSIAGLADSARPATTIYGPFCSELVMRFFEELGLEVMVESVPPEKVSPNALASQKSRLIAVDHAVIAPSDISDNAHGRRHDHGWDRRDLVPYMVRNRESMAMVDEFTLSLESLQSRNYASAVEAAEQASSALHHSLDTALALGSPRHIRAIALLSAQADVLCLAWSRYSVDPEPSSDDPNERRWSADSWELEVLVCMTSELQEQAIRSQILLHLAVMRHMYRNGNLSRTRFARARRREIKIWTDQLEVRRLLTRLEDTESGQIKSFASAALKETREYLSKSLDDM